MSRYRRGSEDIALVLSHGIKGSIVWVHFRLIIEGPGKSKDIGRMAVPGLLGLGARIVSSPVVITAQASFLRLTPPRRHCEGHPCGRTLS